MNKEKEKIEHATIAITPDNQLIPLHGMSIRIMYIWLTGNPMAEDMTTDEAKITVISAFSDSDQSDDGFSDFATVAKKANDVSWDLTASTMILHEDEELRGLIDKYAISRGFMDTIEQ